MRSGRAPDNTCDKKSGRNSNLECNGSCNAKSNFQTPSLKLCQLRLPIGVSNREESNRLQTGGFPISLHRVCSCEEKSYKQRDKGLHKDDNEEGNEEKCDKKPPTCACILPSSGYSSSFSINNTRASALTICHGRH